MKKLLLSLSKNKASRICFYDNGSYQIGLSGSRNANLYDREGTLLQEGVSNGWGINDRFFYYEKDGKNFVCYADNRTVLFEKKVLDIQTSDDYKFATFSVQDKNFLYDLYDADGKPILVGMQRIALFKNGWYFYQKLKEKTGMLVRADGSELSEEIIEATDFENGWFRYTTSKGAVLCRETGTPVSELKSITEACVYPGCHWYSLLKNKQYYLYRADGHKVGTYGQWLEVSSNGMFRLYRNGIHELYDQDGILIDTADEIVVYPESGWYRKKGNGIYMLCRFDKSVVATGSFIIVCGEHLYQIEEKDGCFTYHEDGTLLASAGKCVCYENGMFWLEQGGRLCDKNKELLFDNIAVKDLVGDYGDFVLLKRNSQIFPVAEVPVVQKLLQDAMMSVNEVSEEQFHYFMEYLKLFDKKSHENRYADFLRAYFK